MIAEKTTRITAPVPQWSPLVALSGGVHCSGCGAEVAEGAIYGPAPAVSTLILCAACVRGLVAGSPFAPSTSPREAAPVAPVQEERRPGEMSVTLSWVPGDNLSMTDVVIDRPQGAPSPGPWGDMSLLTVAVYRLQWYLDDYRDEARADLSESV